MSKDQVAIVQTAVDLAQAAVKIDDLLAKVRGGDAAIEEAKRLIDDWRYEAGREFLAVRKQFPARGPGAKGWGDFVAARGISLDTAQRYMQLAELAQARPEAVRGKTVMDIYREHGLALPPPTERFPQGLPAAAENYPVKVKEGTDATPVQAVRTPDPAQPPPPPQEGAARPPRQAADPAPAAAGGASQHDQPSAGGRPDPAGDRPVEASAGPEARGGYTPLFAEGPGAELAGLPRQATPAPSPPPVLPFGVGQTLATSLGDLYLFERCEAQATNRGEALRLWVRPFARPAKGVSSLPLAESWGPGEALLQGGVRVLRVHPDEAIELGKMAPADQAEAVRALFAHCPHDDDPGRCQICNGDCCPCGDPECPGPGSRGCDQPCPKCGATCAGACEEGRETPAVSPVSAGSAAPFAATLRATVTTTIRDRPDRAVELALLLRQLADEADPDHRTEAARQAQADRDLAEILDLRRKVGELEAGHDPAAATQSLFDAERDGYRRGLEECEAAAKAACKQGQEELLQVVAGWLHLETEGVEDLRSEIEGKIQDIQADVLSSVGLALGIVDLDDDNPSLEDVLKAISLLDRPRPCGTCELREAELQQALDREGMSWGHLIDRVRHLLCPRSGNPIEGEAARTFLSKAAVSCPARTDESPTFHRGDRVRLVRPLNLGRIWPKGHGGSYEGQGPGGGARVLLDNGAGLGVVDVPADQIEHGGPAEQITDQIRAEYDQLGEPSPNRATCDAHATLDPIEAARALGADHAEKRRRPWNSKDELGKLLKEVGAQRAPVTQRAEIYAAYKDAFDAGKAARKGA